MVSTERVIAIVEICVYVPVFLLTLFVVFRHGKEKQLGWIYLAIFSAIRLAGAGFKIESENNPTNTTDQEWASILSSIGLSPLLMASLGLLKRITDEVSRHVRSEQGLRTNVMMANSGIVNKIYTKRATASSRRSRTIQLAQLPVMIALILCIIGGTNAADATNDDDLSSAKTKTRVGIVIYILVYVLLFGLVAITVKDISKAPRGEKRIYFAVVAALPFLAVRILYSILSAFTDYSAFSATGANPLVQLFVAIIEEFVIVCMYTLAGLTAHHGERW